MHTYIETHPWITFQLDLKKLQPRTWIKLGEITSKCGHITGVPLRPSTAKKLHSLYLAKGLQATTAIEGNTLSENEVLDRIENKSQLPASKAYLGQEIDNIEEACNLIGRSTLDTGTTEISPDIIKLYNRMVLNKLNFEKGVVPGEIRSFPVVVSGSGYKGAPNEDCDYLLEKLCRWLNSDFPQDDPTLAITYGLLKAILAHVYLAWIHPFGDGNGRTARLVEFQLLLSSGVPTPAAHLLSNHYNQTRVEYYRVLRQSSESKGNVVPFIEYAVDGFLDGLKAQLKIIVDQQLDVAWRNYVHELFKDKDKKQDKRRKHLVLDLSTKESPVPLSQIREISPRVAVSYDRLKSDVTLLRDIKELIEIGLIEKSGNAVMARKDSIRAFLPERAEKRR